VSRNKLFVESSVACKVGSRSLPLSDWTAVVQHLAPLFDFVVSPLSFVEVLRSLALGKDHYIIPNLKRVESLSPIDPFHPVFLEMPGQFILREILGCPRVVETYQPGELAEAMVIVLRLNKVTQELRDWLADIRSNHQSGAESYVNTHDEMRKVGQVVPDRELWLRAKTRQLGILHLSDKEIQKLGMALDAAYEYAAWIRRELKNPHYQPSKSTSAWIDYQQLFYLCDPAMHILYIDGDFTQRTGGSSQQSRLLKLSDVMAQAVGCTI
jgi:hypothetical protein